MKKIMLLIIVVLSLTSCRYLIDYVEEKKIEDRRNRDPVEHVKTEFQKFSAAVCARNTDEYERFFWTDEMLSNVKARFRQKGKSVEEATEVFRAQYTKLFLELDKGAASKYCQMTVEPKVSRRFDRDSIDIDEIVARFADKTERTYVIAGTSEDSYSIRDGILDIE